MGIFQAKQFVVKSERFSNLQTR